LLSLAAVFAYQELVLKRLYPPPTAHTERGVAPVNGSPEGMSAAPNATPNSGVTTQQLAASVQNENPGKKVEVETELFDAVFISRGARLQSFRLKKFHETSAADSPPLEMVKPAPGGDLPLGLELKRGDATIDDRDLEYDTSAPSKLELHPGDREAVTFVAHTRDGLSVTKTFEFTASSYVFDLHTDVSAPPGQLAAVGLEMSQPLTAHKGYYNVAEIQARVDDKTLVDPEKALRKGVEPQTGKIAYAGFGDRYFLSVFLPKEPEQGTLAMSFDGTEARAELLFPVSTASAKLDTQVYVGPKQLDLLEAVNPQLTKAIDFGWTGILALAFLRTLKLFHRIAPNYGVDIIMLTVAFRIVFLPMSIKSQRSMMRLQRLQPQVEKIRDKYSDDKERLNKEMVDLYRRNHVNPLGGCAPMLLQLPMFIGLYQALLNAVELRHAPFMGWIRDLSAPDCLPIPHMPVLPGTECAGIPVLVLLMGASTFLQQWMTPQAADPNQQRMMMLMPLIFMVMFVNFPAGLSLYYFSSNVLGVLQQVFLNREFKQLSPANA
jgi:YidC/Oxa1 family membrane protein insertase